MGNFATIGSTYLVGNAKQYPQKSVNMLQATLHILFLRIGFYMVVAARE
jgi:hypothetical protein